MSIRNKIRSNLVRIVGRRLLWLMAKSCPTVVVGEEPYQKLREKNIPVVLLMWHGRILYTTYYFRGKGCAALVSPSGDGELVAQLIAKWKYKIYRGSGSHSMAESWIRMKKDLLNGGQVIIVADGPKGPNRKMKLGGVKLAMDTGAYLVPFSFSASRKKQLKSWDRFLVFYPFSKLVAVFGEPILVPSDLKDEGVEKMRVKVENVLIKTDEKADRYFSRPNLD